MSLLRDKADKILGADGTEIGNVGDRLKVDAEVTISSLPSTCVTYTSNHLSINGGGGSFEGDLSGTSGNPTRLYRAPSAGEVWYLESLTISIVDGGGMGINNFGSRSGLSNGCLWRAQSQGSLNTLATVTTNLELQNEFPEDSFSVTSTSGWLSEDDNYKGTMRFRGATH